MGLWALPVHLNSWEGNAWIGLSFKWGGKAHLGPPAVKPLVLSQSANQAMWQLQLKGLDIRLRDCSETEKEKNIYKIICGKLSSCFMNSYFLTYGPKLQESIGQLWNWLSSENIFINGNCRLKFRKFQLVVAQLGLDWPWHKYRSTAWLRQYFFLPNG